jgi:GntR family transcriptional repressor for pyruvate dehydrogenase complex
MSEPLLPLHGTGSLSDRLYARMVEGLLSGDLAAGGKLPTEAELASRYAVSRPTVREALARLRSDGVIESRRGSGSHVLRRPGTPQTAATPIRSLADIERYYAFRCCVEAGAAAGAAEFHSAEDLKSLGTSLETLSAAMQAGHTGIDEDVQFHLAIAQASHNPFFVTSVETSVAPIRQFMELARPAEDHHRPDILRQVQAEHQAILDAIARRDPQAAAEATRLHVLNARRRIFEGTQLG